MTSPKPYLVRAYHEWILENNMVPYVVVNAVARGVNVPTEFVQDGKIILNIAPDAALQLQINNDYISFSARFSGKLRDVYVPVYAILAIYARETGKGTIFDLEESFADTNNNPSYTTSSAEDSLSVTPPKPSKPKLTIVKNDDIN